MYIKLVVVLRAILYIFGYNTGGKEGEGERGGGRGGEGEGKGEMGGGGGRM